MSGESLVSTKKPLPTETNMQLLVSGSLEYVWPFSRHQVKVKLREILPQHGSIQQVYTGKTYLSEYLSWDRKLLRQSTKLCLEKLQW